MSNMAGGSFSGGRLWLLVIGCARRSQFPRKEEGAVSRALAIAGVLERVQQVPVVKSPPGPPLSRPCVPDLLFGEAVVVVVAPKIETFLMPVL